MPHRLTEPAAPFHTHDVVNQPPPLAGRNLFTDNTPLVEALEREGGGWALDRAREVGAAWGGDPIRWGLEANENPPTLKAFDRYGHRIDEVEFHRAWHDLMALAVKHELHSLPWTSGSDPTHPAHVARTALYLTAAQAEGGFACPITMTFAAVPALRAAPELAAEWEPRLTATSYDPELGAPSEKRSALCGMAMTEKQGGSDVRANTTVAVSLGGDEYALTGHKWFCSAPMCDMFLMLAQTPEGVSCFALPRILPDGTRNAMHLQRLKDKLGNRSNASSEIELHGAWARIVGEPGRGVPTIIEMVGHTRLDCVIGTAAGMRWGVANATWHAAHRSAFGKRLADQPLMRNVLADLCIESEAASPDVLEAFFHEVGEAAGADARLDAFTVELRDEFADHDAIETRARRIVERMALALQGSLLVRHAPPAVADAFCASRLAGDAGLQYGTLPAGVDLEAIVARHTPAG